MIDKFLSLFGGLVKAVASVWEAFKGLKKFFGK